MPVLITIADTCSPERRVKKFKGALHRKIKDFLGVFLNTVPLMDYIGFEAIMVILMNNFIKVTKSTKVHNKTLNFANSKL